MHPPVMPIVLDADVYSRLERLAEAQERDPVQQARWLLRQALASEQTPHDLEGAATAAR